MDSDPHELTEEEQAKAAVELLDPPERTWFEVVNKFKITHPNWQSMARDAFDRAFGEAIIKAGLGVCPPIER